MNGNKVMNVKDLIPSTRETVCVNRVVIFDKTPEHGKTHNLQGVDNDVIYADDGTVYMEIPEGRSVNDEYYISEEDQMITLGTIEDVIINKKYVFENCGSVATVRTRLTKEENEVLYNIMIKKYPILKELIRSNCCTNNEILFIDPYGVSNAIKIRVNCSGIIDVNGRLENNSIKEYLKQFEYLDKTLLNKCKKFILNTPKKQQANVISAMIYIKNLLDKEEK